MQAIDKIVRLGTIDIDGQQRDVFCKIRFSDRNLSITGVEGPKPNGDAFGSSGQIIHHMDLKYRGQLHRAPGWPPFQMAFFCEIWNRWHLNNMVRGSPAQMAFLRANPVEAVYPESHYEKASEALEAVGLNPDKSHSGGPYKYGSAWLREEVPPDVLDFLSRLPETDKEPPWV